MDSRYYGLIEMLLVFALILAFAFWELYSLRRGKSKSKHKRDAKPTPPDSSSQKD